MAGEFFQTNGSDPALVKQLNAEFATTPMEKAGTILCRHADRKNTAAVSLILKTFPDLVNARDPRKDTALICAAYDGDEPTFDVVLSTPAVDVNAAGEVGTTALIHALYGGYNKLAQKLLALPETNAAQKDNENDSPVIAAVEARDLESLNLILKYPGVNVQDRNRDGDSAASLAEALPQRGKNARVNSQILEAIKTHKSYTQAAAPASRRGGQRVTPSTAAASGEVAKRTPAQRRGRQAAASSAPQPSQFEEIKSDELRKIAVANPHPHALAILRWADGKGLATIEQAANRIVPEKRPITPAALMKFISNPEAIYGNNRTHSGYDLKALTICEKVGYNPRPDYPTAPIGGSRTTNPSDTLG